MLLYLLANSLGSSVQLTTLPLPVLSTLQASGLVFNAICASLILGERFTRLSLGGTLLIVMGAVLIATFGAIPEPAHTLKQLMELAVRKSFLLWMMGQFIVVVIIIGVTVALGRMNRLARRPRVKWIRGLCYGVIAGMLSASCLLLAKSAVELLVRTIVDGVNQFKHYEAWLIVVSFIILVLTQLYFLHLGLKLISTSILYPLAFCTYNIFAILDGLIYFEQAYLLSRLAACLITLGTVILLSGVLMLSWRLEDLQTRSTMAPNVLTPAMGMVDESSASLFSHSSSAESDLECDAEADASSPLISQKGLDESSSARDLRRNSERRRSSSFLRALKGSNDAFNTFNLQRAETDSIWHELHDDAPSPGLSSPTTPLSPFSARKRSLGQYTSGSRRRRESYGVSMDLRAGDDGAGSEDAPLLRAHSDSLTPLTPRAQDLRRRTSRGYGSISEDPCVAVGQKPRLTKDSDTRKGSEDVDKVDGS